MSSSYRPGYGTYADNDPRAQAPLHLHTLPKGHGPASSSTRISTVNPLSSLAHAPSFVPAAGRYDELGRSMGDGVGVDVLKGVETARSGKEGALAFWKGLQLEGKPANGTKTSTDVSLNAVASSSADPTPNPTTATVPARPVVVPREQWFIRRALLAKDQKERENASLSAEGTSGSGDTATPGARPATPSLASLLAADLPPPPMNGERNEVEGFQPPAYFHLNEDNRGWRVLKNIGWDGQGGLGRGDGVSRGAVLDTSRQGDAMKREEAVDTAVVVKGRKGKGKSRESAIDLTLDSASSDSDSDTDPRPSPSRRTPEKFGESFINPPMASSSHEPTGSGPGRTAPVATYLKTDLRGIGALSATDRRRTLLRPTTLIAQPENTSKRKRVTHSAQEIRAAVRDSRNEGAGLVGEERVMWERQKMKKDGERDRLERKRWREIINRDS